MTGEIINLTEVRARKGMPPPIERPLHDNLNWKILKEALTPYSLSSKTLFAMVRACAARDWPLTVEEIIQASDEELLNIRNFGIKSLAEVRSKIGPHLK